MAAPHMMYFHNGPVGTAMPPSPALGLGFAGLQIEGRKESGVFFPVLCSRSWGCGGWGVGGLGSVLWIVIPWWRVDILHSFLVSLSSLSIGYHGRVMCSTSCLVCRFHGL